MKTSYIILSVLFIILLSLNAFANAPMGGANNTVTYAPGRLLVKFTRSAVNSPSFNISVERGTVKTGLSSIDQLNERYSPSNIKKAFIDVQNKVLDDEIGISRWYMFHFPETYDMQIIAEEYNVDINVVDAHPDYIAHPMLVPNDPMYADQWGHHNDAQMLDYCWNCGGHDNGSPVGTVGFDGNVEAAWDELAGYGSSSVIIAILDSGVDVDHPDLNLMAGYDYGDDDSDPDDDSSQPGHGTACAGVAAAIADNNLGVAGVAGGCTVMPLKVSDSGGSMMFSYIDNAIYHAADNGADIISMSLGAATSSVGSTDDALQYAYNAGCTILAATGNENQQTISYPAINQYVIAVGAASPCGERKRSSSNPSEVSSGIATDPNGYTCDGERWWGSNYGASASQDAAGAVDIIAPTILPTCDIGGSGGYESGDYNMWFNGTSCATPFAAGVCGLIISQNPTWTPAQVRQQLVDTADDVTGVESGSGWDVYAGYGMVNAGAALGGGGTPPPPQYCTSQGNDASYEWIAQVDIGSFSNSSGGAGYTDFTGQTVNVNTGNTAVTLTPGFSGSGYNEYWKIWIDLNEDADFEDADELVFDAGSMSQSAVSGDMSIPSAYAGVTTRMRITMKYNGAPTSCEAFSYGEVEDYTVTIGGGATNQAPTAEANGPYTGTTGQAVAFSSAGSSDSDGSIASYEWNFGDGNTSTQANPTHTYASAGTYTVTLTVTDNDGATGSDNATATISDPASNYATLPYTTGFESGLDNYWTTESENSYGRIQTTTSNTPHSGSYHLTMDVTTNGNFCQNEAWLHLDLSGETQVDLTAWWKEFGDETHSQDGIYFSDDDGSNFVKVHNLEGGSTSNNTWQELNLDVDQLASANGVSLTSTFIIKFQQYDNYSMTTDGFAFDDIDVSAGSAPSNNPPTANANGAYTGTEGEAVTFSSAGSSDSDGSIASYEWNFGDGNTSTDANPTHTYTTAGTYTVTLTVTDDDGATGSDQTSAEISTAPVGDYATLPYSTGFESGLDSYWSTTSANGYGRIQTTTSNTPHSGSYHLTMDVTTNGNYCQNEAWLKLNLTGETEVDLSFWWKEFGDETHSQDGIYFSDDDGANFVKVQDLNGQDYTNSTWTQFDLDVDQLASANGLTLTGTFIVKFQQYDNYAMTTDGFAFDDISVTAGSAVSYITSETEGNGSAGSANGLVGEGVDVSANISTSSDEDWFYFDLSSTGNLNVSVDIGSSADLDWYLYHESDTGNYLTRGYTTNDPEAASYDATQTGRYYVKVVGYNGATSSYTLSITSGGAGFLNTGKEKDDFVASTPKAFGLGQNFPNPFNPTTTIPFDIESGCDVTLKIYNMQGQLVRTLVEGFKEAGTYNVLWDGKDERGRDVGTGSYIYNIVAGENTSTQRMILMK